MSVRAGFTLVEVVMAFLVLELGVLGALATVVFAVETQRRAELIEAATVRSRIVVDSLRGGARPDTVDAVAESVRLRWTLDGSGRLELRAVDDGGSELLRVRTTVPLMDASAPVLPPP